MKVTDKFVFFWKESFSQWYKRTFEVDGMEFNCNEQYMMWRKAKMFGDEDTAEEIMMCEDPWDQKALGRAVKNFNKFKWDSVSQDIVYEGNYAKFTQHPDLKKKLLSHGDRIFVEASPKDNLWGIGMAEDEKGVEDPANWRGENWLGLVLTRVRNTIVAEDKEV